MNNSIQSGHMLHAVARVWDAIQDDESRYLFDLRMKFALYRDEIDYLIGLGVLYDDWVIPQNMDGINRLVIYGCGSGTRMKTELELVGFSCFAYCDNGKAGQEMDGLPIYDSKYLSETYDDVVFVINSPKYGMQMIDDLRVRGVQDNRIISFPHRYPAFMRGWQYFDTFSPEGKEIFVDAGAYDGATIRDFVKWSGGVYEKAYSFEPLPDMYQMIESEFAADPRIHVINAAAWEEKERLHFTRADAGSTISNNGDIEVEAIDIDSICKGRITFIKMDIEGSELKALKGAKQTIIKFRPKLAICIYHKAADIIELGNYILDLVPEYRLYIRHYCSNMWETVLYAEV